MTPAVALGLAVLELGPSATADEVRRAFRRLAARHHPDIGGSCVEMQALGRARDAVLGWLSTRPDRGDVLPRPWRRSSRGNVWRPVDRGRVVVVKLARGPGAGRFAVLVVDEDGGREFVGSSYVTEREAIGATDERLRREAA